MADHYDAALAQARQSLAEAKERAHTDWMADYEVEVLQRSLEELELEAATWRALTPEERQHLIDEREARMAEIDHTDVDETEDDENYDDWLDGLDDDYEGDD